MLHSYVPIKCECLIISVPQQINYCLGKFYLEIKVITNGGQIRSQYAFAEFPAINMIDQSVAKDSST